MPLNWNEIRPLDGSQSHGFEELCAQLARAESPQDARFERKGAPDAGVECYCVLDNRSEWGWQAKYFDTMNKSRWAQLDRSVEMALDKHPALIRYFVCIPLDRSDARISGQKATLQRWNERVEKWCGWAQDRNMSVEFVWWGGSELLERLSQSEHIGRVYFWFGQRVFDKPWFKERLDEAVTAAGPRYTPEIHIDLPIVRDLEIFGRSESVFEELKSLAKGIRTTFQHLEWESGSQKDDRNELPSVQGLSDLIDGILHEFSRIKPEPIGDLPFTDITKKITSAIEEVDTISESLSQLEREYLANKTNDAESRSYNNLFRGRFHYVYQLRDELEEARSSLEHANSIASSRLMLLKGKAGTGKTHLLCDFAKKRLASAAPSILFMGQRFVANDAPWTQALQQLDLPGMSAEQFIGALEAAAQAAGHRVLLIIDALNEGQGRIIWPAHLAAFLETLKKSLWVGVLLSVRSEYEEVVIPKAVYERAVHLEHHGFDEHEYDATQTFFAYYDLEFPSTPILQPEFRNPLFLKTICLGLKASGEKRLPRGFHGITKVFDLFLRAINKRLAESLGFNPGDQLVLGALEKLADRLIVTDERWLERREAENIVDELLPNREFERSLYRGLVVEGILTEEMVWREKNVRSEIVYISYDRFADHAIAASLLRTYLDVNTPQAAFEEGGPLSFIWDNEERVSPGLLEALCIQVPELVYQELVSLAPALLNLWSIGEAFRQSIVWRRLDAFSEKTREVLNQLTQNEYDLHNTLEVLLTVATVEGHSFNAESLDKRLRRDSMPERDAWWSVYLHRAWGTHGAIDRLVDWASAVKQDSRLDKKTVELCSITLAWMLTTSHRFLRDRATKALVSLLTNRCDLVIRLVDRFSDVNDPYVAERIYAVTYGVAMRSHDTIGVGRLALLVYEKIFVDGVPPVHILLRDYARLVIERAIYLGANLDIDKCLIRPPYKSTWPRIPDENEVRSLVPDLSTETPNNERTDWERVTIKMSVMDDGDFARYVIGTNSHSTNWLSLRIDDEPWRPPDDRMRMLLQRLNAEEWSAFEKYQHAEGIVLGQQLSRYWSAIVENLDSQTSEEGDDQKGYAEQSLEVTLESLRSTLTKEHLAEFDDILLAKDQDSDKVPPYFDLRLIQRYILWRVFDMGWTSERFGAFDRSVNGGSTSLNASKPERMGKKYQWIAYHEILAHIADNYQYRERFREDEDALIYEGPWDSFLRDIDPSCTLSSTSGGTSCAGHDPPWWAPFRYDNWSDSASHQEWIERKSDIPGMENFLKVTEPDDESYWINIDSSLHWQQTPPADVEPHDVDRRNLWMACADYFLRAEDSAAFVKWAKAVDFWGRWMPESATLHEMYLGEYMWSPVFRHFNRPYYGIEGWTQPGKDCPVSVRAATCSYLKEYGGFDCSVDETYSLRMPDHKFIERLGLKWSGNGADYLDESGTLIAFDPTAHKDGPSALLIREDVLRQYLSEHRLALCWVVLGEKNVYTNQRQRPEEWHGRLRISGVGVLEDRGPRTWLQYFHDDRQRA